MKSTKKFISNFFKRNHITALQDGDKFNTQDVVSINISAATSQECHRKSAPLESEKFDAISAVYNIVREEYDPKHLLPAMRDYEKITLWLERNKLETEEEAESNQRQLGR